MLYCTSVSSEAHAPLLSASPLYRGKPLHYHYHCCCCHHQVRKANIQGLPVKTATGELVYQPTRKQLQAAQVHVEGVTVQDSIQLEQQMIKAEKAAAKQAAAAEAVQAEQERQQEQQQRPKTPAPAADQGNAVVGLRRTWITPANAVTTSFSHTCLTQQVLWQPVPACAIEVSWWVCPRLLARVITTQGNCGISCRCGPASCTAESDVHC